MQVKIRMEAERDLGDAAVFYNSRSNGVGDAYLDYMNEELAALSETAGTHRKTQGCHRKLVKRFPYAIYYLVQENIVEVVAVLNQRRGPQYVKQRLTDL